MRSALIATLASVAAMGAYAHPHTRGSASLSKRAIDLDKFRMVVKTEYKNATAVDADPTIPTLRARATPEETANELVAAQAPDAEFRLSGDHYTSKNGVTHLYFKQTANGLDIDNADFNVNVCLSTYLGTKAKLTFGRLARTAKSSLSATLSSRARFLRSASGLPPTPSTVLRLPSAPLGFLSRPALLRLRQRRARRLTPSRTPAEV
jgi:hypothetical protein